MTDAYPFLVLTVVEISRIRPAFVYKLEEVV